MKLEKFDPKDVAPSDDDLQRMAEKELTTGLTAQDIVDVVLGTARRGIKTIGSRKRNGN